MFSFAVFDVRQKQLLVARDRFGIKPLFYAVRPDYVAFASELNALRLVPGIDVEPDRQAVYDFAALFYVPAPNTFFRGIKALEPGQCLTVTFDGNIVLAKPSTYHQFSISPNPNLTLDVAAERAAELITSAVQGQLQSDVPLGAMLSGGIDSSLVCAAAMSETCPRLNTFNVQFPDAEYDETWAATETARCINSKHTILSLKRATGTWNSVTRMLQHLGQPFADTSVFAANAVCSLMRQHVKVALSGDGGDEAFGGYNTFWQLARIAKLQQLPTAWWHVGTNVLRPLAWIGAIPARLLQRMVDLRGADDITVLESLHCWTTASEHRLLCRDDRMLPIRRHIERKWDHVLATDSTRLERLSALATEVRTRLTLPNDYLFKVDMASMSEGLEVRVPLLNEELFAFGMSIPHKLKVQGRTCKRVLRKVAAQTLPCSISSKPKMGFGIPMDIWLDSDFKTQAYDVLLGKNCRVAEYFNPDVYRPWLMAFSTDSKCESVSRQGLYQRIIMLLSLHCFTEAAKTVSYGGWECESSR
jgi:asparagine synthase (glutamine-hydrolysing)